MSKNLEVGVKITADGKLLVGEARAAKDALNQIGETAKRTNTESAAAAERFTANLKRQADTLGMTASQVRGYDAAQLKLNEAQRASVEASNRATAAYESKQSSILNLKSGLIAAAGAYVSLGAAIGGGKAVIDAALAQERLNNTLKVATGSAENAAREMQFLRQESEKLGLQFTATASQYGKLAAASKGTALEGQATRDIFLGVAKASTVLGLRADEAAGALNAIQQMISKGNVAAEELRGQLGERLPGAFQMAARAMGVTTQELDKMLVKGEVTAARLLPALALELEKTFGAQAQEAAQGLGAKINRLDNAFTDLKIAIGNTGLLDLLSNGIVLATRFVDALSGAKVLSAVDAQKQKISEMRAELESLGNRKHIPLIGDLLFDKKQADLLSQRIDDGVRDLQKLEKAAQEASEAVSGKKALTPGAKPELPKEWSDALENQAKAAKKAADERVREAQRAVEASTKIIAALKLETEQIGLNAIQKRMMSAATEAAKAPTKELAAEIMASAAAWGYAAQQQENLQAAEKERVEGLKAIEQAEKAAARASEDAARKSSAEWNQLWGGVETTAKTAFIQFAAHGKSAMESIGESIKIAILDVLYQLTVRKWVINIGASLSGLAGAGAANAATSGGGSILNLASSGLNAANLFKSGFGLPSMLGRGVSMLGSTIGSSSLGAFGSGMMGIGATGASTAAFSTVGGAGTAFIGGAGTALGGTGMGAAASMGASVAAFAGPAIAIAAVDQITRMLAGDKLIGGGVGKVLNYVPVLGPLLNGLFGRGPLKQQGTLLTGEIGAEGFESGYLQTRFKAKGGLFRSDKIDYARVDATTGEVWTDNNKLLDYANDLSKTGKELFGLINDTTKQTSSSLRQIGDDLGVSTEGIDNFRHSINLLSEKGKMLTEEQIGEEIQKITDGLAHSLLPQVDELAKRGETALQTVSRLGTEFTSLVDAATLVLGKSAADAKSMILGASFEGRTAFVDNAGGIDALNQASQFFGANFLTDAERLAPKQEFLNSELTKLGLPIDLTREQYRGLVQSFGQLNGITEETLQSLLKLQYTFVDVRNAQDQLRIANEQAAAVAQVQAMDVINRARQQTETVAAQRSGLETQILQLQGDTTALRQSELEALDPVNRALQERIYLIQDEKTAAENAMQSVGSTFSALQRSAGAERTRITDDYNTALDLSNTRIRGVTESVGKLKTLSEALKSTVSQLRPLDRDQARQQIQNAINTARSGGNLPAADSLRDALNVLGSQTAKGTTSSFEAMREQRKTANLVAELGDLTGAQLTLEERSLAALEAQKKRLEDGFKAEINLLDSLLTQGQAQIDALNGIDTSILSLADALTKFYGSVGQAGQSAGGGQAGGAAAGTGNSGQSAVTAATSLPLPPLPPVGVLGGAGNPAIGGRDIVRFLTSGVTPEQGLAKALETGVSARQIVNAFAGQQGYTLDNIRGFVQSQGLVPGFAEGGFHRGGLRIVGERGPELEYTGPSRIASNNDLKRMMSNDDVVEKLSLLITALEKNNEFNRRVANKLDAVTAGGTALRTKSA